MLYLANDVLQNGKRKGVQQFIESFGDVLPEQTPLFRDERIAKQVDRVFSIWAERSVFSSEFTKSLKEILHESKHSSSHHRSSSKHESSSEESGKPKNPEVERIILEFKPAAEGMMRSEDGPVNEDCDMDEEFLSTGADVPFAEFVAIGNDVPTCEPQSIAEIVAEVVGDDAAEMVADEARKDGSEYEGLRPPTTFTEALADLEALQSFFHTKDNENADKALQCVQKELFLSKGETHQQKITMFYRSHGQQFQKDFDEATRCLEEYIKALEKEVLERTELIGMLEDAKVYYDSQNGEARIVASAYKNFGNRVKGLKKKLEAKIKTLPSPVPSPTPDAPSPTNSDDGLQLPAIQETAEYSAPDAEAPLTDNGAVIDSPCSAPSPGSAPSPEGSPVGLSPVVPGTADSGTTSNATGNAAALSSFMSQSPTVLSSWLDAFNQEFQENRAAAPTALNTSAIAASIPAQSTLESRLSNLMQSMGHIPGGLFSSTSSASNTPKRADSPPYSTAVFRPVAAVSDVHSGNTPLKDENSGQGTPVLDENTARKVASLMDSDMRVLAAKPTTPQDSPDARLNTPFGSRIPSLASPKAWVHVSPKAGSSNAAATQSAPALAPPPIPPALQAYLEPIKTVTGAASRSIAAAPKGRSETPPSPSADYLIPVAENFDVTDMELDDDGSGDDEHAESLHHKKPSNLITLVQPQVSPVAETASPGSICSEKNEDDTPQLDTPAQPAVVTPTLKLTPSLASQDDMRHMRNPSPDLEKEDLDFPVQEVPSEPRRCESTDFAAKESSKFSLRDSLDFDARKSAEFRLLETSDYTTRERSEFRVRESSASSEFRVHESPPSDYRRSELPSSEFRIRDSSSEFRIRDSPSSSEFQVHDSFASEFHATPAKIETVQMRSSLDRSPPLGPVEDRGTWERADYYSPRAAHHQPQQQQQQAMSNGGNRMRGRSSSYYGYEMRGRPVDRYHEGYGAYESEWHGGRPPSPRYRHYGGQARGAPYFQPRY
ncbi:hypothetical protein HPB50_006072 [Hyalomma asiaticum]|uniref:Uncharacterized protein n=1 Tax=Hyalomma asiaticum TaxID=266040 RepID=A0ACB7STQ0_HYAAI|nr:hypothetical protein HPB50_006072 [Hyalomma asiaticum]